MSICVAKQHVQARNLVYCTQQPRELLEAAHRSAGQREASELGIKLEGMGETRGQNGVAAPFHRRSEAGRGGKDRALQWLHPFTQTSAPVQETLSKVFSSPSRYPSHRGTLEAGSGRKEDECGKARRKAGE